MQFYVNTASNKIWEEHVWYHKEELYTDRTAS